MSEIHAKVLRRAKKYYKTTKKFGTCFSLNQTFRDSQAKEFYQILTWLEKVVTRKYGYYEDWLYKKHRAIYDTMSNDDFVKARCKWIDWMIANNHIFDNIKVK